MSTAFLRAESALIHAFHKYLILHINYYDQSAVHSSSGSKLYQRHVTRVPLSIQTYDSGIKVHGMVLAYKAHAVFLIKSV